MKPILTLLLALILLTKPVNAEDLIVFSADWCPSCVVLKDFLKNNRQKIKKYDLQILDIDVNKDLQRKFRVTRIPTSIIISDDGKELNRIIGYSPTTYTRWLQNNE